MKLRLTILPEQLAVCRLAADEAIPGWIRGAFTSVTRTAEELSIVCASEAPPENVQAERGWRGVKVSGPIPFEVTGVAAALVAPLAAAGISVFLMATYDTDYLLLKADVFELALSVLRNAGHDVS